MGRNDLSLCSGSRDRGTGYGCRQGGRKHPQQEYIQINTKDILFICGGAFDGLEKNIENRLGRQQIGFNTALHGADAPKEVDKKNPFAHVEPDDPPVG